jgi:tripartite ATP-independent transporter DctP family solute receptor
MLKYKYKGGSKVMKKTVSLLLALLLVVSVFAVGITGCAPKTKQPEKPAFTPKAEYNLSLVVGPTFWWGEGAQKFADMVKKDTDGKVNIKVYPGGQLFKGKQTNEFQLMSQGVIDFALGSTINWSPTIPECNIFSLPFFINNYKNLDALENGETGKAVFSAMDKKGVIGLAWAENGFREVTNSKHEIKEPADLKGLKLRVVGSPIFIDIFKQLGADPVSMSWGDAVTAFQQGVVDGQENPMGVLIPVKIWQYHKYVTLWNYVVDPVIVGVNKQVWDSFPANIQEAIKKDAIEAARWEKDMCRIGLDDGSALQDLKDHFGETPEITDYIKYLEDQGMKVTQLTDQERQDFIDATKPIYDKWIPKIGEDLYNKAKKDMGQ